MNLAALRFDPYDYEIQEDPYPTYALMREQAPLYRDPVHGYYALSRYADVHAAFRDPGTFSSAMGVTLDASAWGPDAHALMSVMAMDPPDQTRLRSLVSRGFTAKRIAELEPRITAIVRQHLAPALDRRSFDFVADLAEVVPMDVISDMMGVPPADRAEVLRLATRVVHRPPGARDIPAAGVEAAMSLVAYYTDLLAERRRRPADDLLSALLAVEAEGDRLSEAEILGFLFLMVVAGHETTVKLLANAVYWGSMNPDQLALPMSDPTRVGDWVEETVRFDTSTQVLARHVTTDVELHGSIVPRGSQLLLLPGSANRDPRVFDRADVYDLDRDTSASISFGGGRHFCLGAHLARLEGKVALTQLVHAVKAIDVDHDGAERVHSMNVRGFAHLPVTLTPR